MIVNVYLMQGAVQITRGMQSLPKRTVAGQNQGWAEYHSDVSSHSPVKSNSLTLLQCSCKHFLILPFKVSAVSFLLFLFHAKDKDRQTHVCSVAGSGFPAVREGEMGGQRFSCSAGWRQWNHWPRAPKILGLVLGCTVKLCRSERKKHVVQGQNGARGSYYGYTFLNHPK